MLDRMLSLLIAVTLACLAWLYARNRDPEVLDNVPVPVQVALVAGQAESYDLELNAPAQVPVSFKGPPSRMRELRQMLQEGGVVVSLILSVPDERKGEAKYLDTLRVDAADVPAPPGVTPMVLEGRNRIPVTLRRVVQRRLPVRLDPPPDDRVNSVRIEPETVLVRGPKVILDRARAVLTQACLLSGGPEGGPEQQQVSLGAVPLVRELDGRPIACVPDAVSVRVTFRSRERVYELAGVRVHFLCPAGFRLRPRFADPGSERIGLAVAGPSDREPAGVIAFVDLTRRPFKPGIYVNESLTVQLPGGYRLVREPAAAPPFELAPLRVDVVRAACGPEPGGPGVPAGVK